MDKDIETQGNPKHKIAEFYKTAIRRKERCPNLVTSDRLGGHRIALLYQQRKQVKQFENDCVI
jgi:hypothetical protein